MKIKASVLEKLACAMWASEKCTTPYGIDILVWENMSKEAKVEWLRLARRQYGSISALDRK
jgi:hypothetical protein